MVGARSAAPVSPQRADERHINRYLHASKGRESMRDNLEPAPVGQWQPEVQVAEEDVGRDPSSRLPAERSRPETLRQGQKGASQGPADPGWHKLLVAIPVPRRRNGSPHRWRARQRGPSTAARGIPLGAEQPQPGPPPASKARRRRPADRPSPSASARARAGAARLSPAWRLSRRPNRPRPGTPRQIGSQGRHTGVAAAHAWPVAGKVFFLFFVFFSRAHFQASQVKRRLEQTSTRAECSSAAQRKAARARIRGEPEHVLQRRLGQAGALRRCRPCAAQGRGPNGLLHRNGKLRPPAPLPPLGCSPSLFAGGMHGARRRRRGADWFRCCRRPPAAASPVVPADVASRRRWHRSSSTAIPAWPAKPRSSACPPSATQSRNSRAAVSQGGCGAGAPRAGRQQPQQGEARAHERAQAKPAPARTQWPPTRREVAGGAPRAHDNRVGQRLLAGGRELGHRARGLLRAFGPPSRQGPPHAEQQVHAAVQGGQP